MALIVALVEANTAHGAITVYGGEFVGGPLFCSTAEGPLRFDPSSPPFAALPITEHNITWQCGDLLYIPGVGMFRALDAGPFGDHCVASGDQCAPIVADVPAHLASFEGLSMVGEVINLSAVVRACRERGLCD